MEMEVTIEIKGMQQIQHKINQLVPAGIKAVLTRSHNRIKIMLVKAAHNYAPISPSKGQYIRTLKTGITKRHNFNPGGLTRSIIGKATEDYVELFVASNSDGGQYAKKMHEWQGGWGEGTKARGPQAGNTFITRAITDNEGNIIKIYESELDKEINRLNHGQL